jgi:hypothetical protein
MSLRMTFKSPRLHLLWNLSSTITLIWFPKLFPLLVAKAMIKPSKLLPGIAVHSMPAVQFQATQGQMSTTQYVVLSKISFPKFATNCLFGTLKKAFI